MTDKFRQAADSENFPYDEDTTPFIMAKGGKVTWAGRKTDKIAMLKERGGKILAVWPGKWSSDVFEINDRVRALAALGDSSAMKALSTCDHTFKIHEERQVTSRTRSVEVELLCGCMPDYFGPEILDVQRQLTDALGCQVKDCGGAAPVSMARAPTASTWPQAPAGSCARPEPAPAAYEKRLWE